MAHRYAERATRPECGKNAGWQGEQKNEKAKRALDYAAEGQASNPKIVAGVFRRRL